MSEVVRSANALRESREGLRVSVDLLGTTPNPLDHATGLKPQVVAVVDAETVSSGTLDVHTVDASGATTAVGRRTRDEITELTTLPR